LLGFVDCGVVPSLLNIYNISLHIPQLPYPSAIHPMKLSSVVALFSVATSALGEKSAPATSDGSTAEAALTPNFSALSQHTLNQLSSLMRKPSIYLADTAISAYKASFKSCLASVDYNKLSTDAQEKFREVQDGVLAIDYKHLPTDVKDWIIAHPYQTAFHVAGGVVFFAPSLVSTPLLGVLGWTSVGPRTGTILIFWDLH
jgi:hypothetical protein